MWISGRSVSGWFVCEGEWECLCIVVAISTLSTLSQLLDDASPAIVKVAIQALTGAYPLVFRQL